MSTMNPPRWRLPSEQGPRRPSLTEWNQRSLLAPAPLAQSAEAEGDATAKEHRTQRDLNAATAHVTHSKLGRCQ